MADVRMLKIWQQDLERNLLALRSANASDSVFIQHNINNLKKDIKRLLHVVNQKDGSINTYKMPPPPTPK